MVNIIALLIARKAVIVVIKINLISLKTFWSAILLSPN